MQFTLTINLGNDAMQTGHDLGNALRNVADHIVNDERNPYDDLPLGDHGIVWDDNGNRVGTWQITLTGA